MIFLIWPQWQQPDKIKKMATVNGYRLFCYLVKSLYLMDFAEFLPFRRRMVDKKGLSGYLSEKVKKRKSPWSCYASWGLGGEQGIRTLEPLLTVTRFPIGTLSLYIKASRPRGALCLFRQNDESVSEKPWYNCDFGVF